MSSILKSTNWIWFSRWTSSIFSTDFSKLLAPSSCINEFLNLPPCISPKIENIKIFKIFIFKNLNEIRKLESQFGKTTRRRPLVKHTWSVFQENVSLIDRQFFSVECYQAKIPTRRTHEHESCCPRNTTLSVKNCHHNKTGSPIELVLEIKHFRRGIELKLKFNLKSTHIIFICFLSVKTYLLFHSEKWEFQEY